MSTLKTTNLQHPSAVDPAIVLDADGDVTYAGVHDFSAATVTGAPQGLQLITPASVATGGGSSSVSGGSITFTGVTQIALNGVFSSDFDNYEIKIIVTASTSAQLFYRLRSSGTNDSGSNYINQELDSNITNVLSRSFTRTEQRLIYLNSTNKNAANLTLFDPFLSAQTMCVSYGGSGDINNNVTGRHTLSSSYDGIAIQTSTGTISGVIRVYGYRN